MTPETLLPASSSGERRRAAQEPRAPVHAWDPNGPSAPVAPILWDALRDSVLWAEAEWERVAEHAAGAEEATHSPGPSQRGHSPGGNRYLRRPQFGPPQRLSRRLLGLIRGAFITRGAAFPRPTLPSCSEFFMRSRLLPSIWRPTGHSILPTGFPPRMAWNWSWRWRTTCARPSPRFSSWRKPCSAVAAARSTRFRNGSSA